MLRAFVNGARNDWDGHLPVVCAAYRSTPHASIGISPFRMVYGHEMTLPIDLQNDVGLRKHFPKCPEAYMEWLRLTLNRGHDIAREILKESAARQKKNYQSKCRELMFSRGDFVLKVDPVMHHGKLHNKNEGAFLVLNQTGPVTYAIQSSEYKLYMGTNYTDIRK